MMAYQIGFDLYESATQQFLQRVQAALRQTAPLPIQTVPIKPTTADVEGSERWAFVRELASKESL